VLADYGVFDLCTAAGILGNDRVIGPALAMLQGGLAAVALTHELTGPRLVAAREGCPPLAGGHAGHVLVFLGRRLACGRQLRLQLGDVLALGVPELKQLFDPSRLGLGQVAPAVVAGAAKNDFNLGDVAAPLAGRGVDLALGRADHLFNGH
jgi:hypothetical protein